MELLNGRVVDCVNIIAGSGVSANETSDENDMETTDTAATAANATDADRAN